MIKGGVVREKDKRERVGAYHLGRNSGHDLAYPDVEGEGGGRGERLSRLLWHGQLLEQNLPGGHLTQRDLNRTAGPEAKHATVLGSKPLLDFNK